MVAIKIAFRFMDLFIKKLLSNLRIFRKFTTDFN